MPNSKLPKNWRSCTEDFFVWAVLSQTQYSVVEDQLDLTRDFSYLSELGYEYKPGELTISDYTYFALHAGTPIRKKNLGKLPKNWKPPMTDTKKAYTGFSTVFFNRKKRNGEPLSLQSECFKETMAGDEVFLNKLYCGLLTK